MEKHVYMHITEPLCYTAELTQHCKSTILQFKIENEKKKDSHQSASKQT